MGDPFEASADLLEIDDKDLSGSQFTKVRLSGSAFRDAQMLDCLLEDVNASRLTVRNVNLAGGMFEDVNGTGLRMANTNLTNATIERANLDGMTIDGIDVNDMLALWRATYGKAS